jgi:hypothetical protein
MNSSQAAAIPGKAAAIQISGTNAIERVARLETARLDANRPTSSPTAIAGLAILP